MIDPDILAYRQAEDRLVVARLREAGILCDSVYDFVNGPTPRSAVPVLVTLLDVIREHVILQGIVRALRTKSAKGKVEARLIALFRSLPTELDDGLKWAIGNTLGGLDRQAIAEDLLTLAADKSQGSGRQMIVDALWSIKGAHVTEALIELLADEDVNGHAISALRRRHAREAIPTLERFEEHPNAWKRNSAARAISAIRRFNSTRH